MRLNNEIKKGDFRYLILGLLKFTSINSHPRRSTKGSHLDSIKNTFSSILQLARLCKCMYYRAVVGQLYKASEQRRQPPYLLKPEVVDCLVDLMSHLDAHRGI